MRDINKLMGFSTEGSAPVQKPPSAVDSHRNTELSTDEQRKVAQILGANVTTPAPPASAASDAVAPTPNSRLGLLNANPDISNRWYETGTVPEAPSLDLLQSQRQAISNLGSYGEIQKPQMEPSSPQFNARQTALQDEREAKAMYEQARTQEHQDAVKAHEQRVAEAKARHDAAEAEHRRNVNNYNRAMSEHNFAKTMTPEMMYSQYLKDQASQTPRIESPTSEVQVVKTPLGGTGTSKYAQEFGATPEEAQRIASMSATQKENIPRQQAALEAVNKMFPNMPVSKYEGYPLLLAGESGEQYLKEKMAPEHQAKLAQEKALAEEAKVRQMLAERLAEHKAQALTDYERHKETKEESAARLKEARKHLDSNKAPEAPKATPAEVRANIQQEKKIVKLEEAIDAMRKGFRPNLGSAGFDEYTNVYPSGHGAGDLGYAHELLKGIADPKLDEASKELFRKELKKLETRNKNLLPAIEKFYKP